MQDGIWAELEDLRGVKRDDPRTWSVDYAAVGMQRPKTDPVFAPMSSPRLIGAISDLMGSETWHVPDHWGGFKITFPDASPES